jgi:hypothetical protein
MNRGKPHIVYSTLYGSYMCRLKGTFNGYGRTPRDAYNDWVERHG